MRTTLIETSDVCVTTNENRVLFTSLNMSLSREKVALIGRNGVGKSTLLNVLCGKMAPTCGEIILKTKPHLVPQSLNQKNNIEDTILWFKSSSICNEFLEREFAAAGLRTPKEIFCRQTFSHGEFRKLKLLIAKLSQPQLLILDEPTQDLDENGILWLRSWLSQWQDGLLLASHEAQILQDFQDFFIVAETGCRYFCGTFAKLEEELEKEHLKGQENYLRNLNRLIKKEEHTVHVARRRGRKKRYGRISELDRATSRQTLNQKRDYAQVKHGKMKKIRDERIHAIREWTKSTRQMLKVELPLVLPELKLSTNNSDIITLENVSAKFNGNCLFEKVCLYQRRERLAIIGANGTGKTTLLEIMLGNKKPFSGYAKRDSPRIGSIAQGGTDWMLEDTLLSYLSLHCSIHSPKVLTELLVSHKFPLALAQRPMYSLSPGERVRAALICLFQRLPVIELLVLDEPTCSLDLIGQNALTKALKAWQGGLIIASHNTTFLKTIGMDQYLQLPIKRTGAIP